MYERIHGADTCSDVQICVFIKLGGKELQSTFNFLSFSLYMLILLVCYYQPWNNSLNYVIHVIGAIYLNPFTITCNTALLWGELKYFEEI